MEIIKGEKIEGVEIIEKGNKDYVTILENTIKSLKSQLKELLSRKDNKYKSCLTIKQG